MTTIEQAVMLLAGRCDGAKARDGAGFSKWDAGWGRSTADAIAAGEAVDERRALAVLRKYQRQLATAGIVLPDQPRPEAPAAAPSSSDDRQGPGTVTVSAASHGGLALSFAYDPALVQIARGLPQRRFDPVTKAWLVPLSALDAVRAAFPSVRLDPEFAGALAAETARRDATALAEERSRTEALARYEADPAKAGLYAHQDDGVRYLLATHRAIVADDLGLGKTREALVAAKALGHHIIVVAPAGLRVNWLREAEAVDAVIEVFSWAKVPEPVEAAYTLIADEAHYAQSMTSARTKRMLALAAKAQAVFLLTGTPIKNGRPANLYPLLAAVKHELAADRRAYEIRYCAAKATRWTRWDVTGAAHLDELHARTADRVLRRLKAECLDLPPKVRVLRSVEMSAESERLYRETLEGLQKDYRERKAKGEIKEADALVMLGHLRHAGSLGKVETAVELAEEVLEQGGQVVLFAAYRDTVDRLVGALGAGRISGDDDAESRTRTIDAFQAGSLRAIVCSLGAGNVGITLTAAQTVILVDRPWTPGDAVQTEDRCHRIGQRGSVTCLWLQANGADQLVDHILEQKQERIELVLAGKRKTLRGLGSMTEVAEAVLG